MKYLIIVLFLGLTIPETLAQHISGVVMEEDRQGKFNPLPGVNVYWAGTTSGTTTDTTGYFHIPAHESSSKLVFSYIGYKADTITITQPHKITVVLKNSKELDEVEVVYREKSTTISFLDPVKTETISERELFKAACCNLSESFETNPSVDVSFTDAITGTKQVQMLGLTGNYVQITREQMPFIRGLSSGSGLTFIPGTWLSSIQISKGTGSAVNGYEGIAGQINTELKKQADEEHLFLNGYGSQDGRAEINLNHTRHITDKTATTLLLHSSIRPVINDMNKDGFADMPGGYQLNLMNRWEYHGLKGWESQFGITGLVDHKAGGQNVPGFDYNSTPWLYEQQIQRGEAWVKAGYLFPEQRYKSFGMQASFSYTELDAGFGVIRYAGQEENGYLNLIYQSIINNTNHKFRTGSSLLYSRLREQFGNMGYGFTELVPGAFFEYTYSNTDRFTAVAGIRADYHNLYGLFATPRLHMRYAINEKTVLRASGGKGYRTPAVFAENLSYFAGNRQLILPEQSATTLPYGFAKQEQAWTAGLSLTREFRLDYRDGMLSADFYHSTFENQLVADLEQSGQVRFYNLDGISYANSLQAQADYELFRRFDLRLAYRYYDVWTTYMTGLREKPFTGRHRAFANMAYETKNKWKFDYTVQYHGSQRLPDTGLSPEPYRLPGRAPEFVTMNAQISKPFGKHWEVYLGMENITNFRLDDPIISADDTRSPWFDGSMTWGPVFGRMAYGGFRFKIKESHDDH